MAAAGRGSADTGHWPRGGSAAGGSIEPKAPRLTLEEFKALERLRSELNNFKRKNS